MPDTLPPAVPTMPSRLSSGTRPDAVVTDARSTPPQSFHPKLHYQASYEGLSAVPFTLLIA